MREKSSYTPGKRRIQKFDPKASYKAGDKIYWNNRKKAIIASTIGIKKI